MVPRTREHDEGSFRRRPGTRAGRQLRHRRRDALRARHRRSDRRHQRRGVRDVCPAGVERTADPLRARVRGSGRGDCPARRRVVQLRETLLSAGYAVAYSSYAENGWAVKDGAARTHELRDLFSSRFGAPTHVYVMGRSLGGLITVFLAETFPGAYQGALALCGPLGGGRLETDYIGNVRVLFDHFFPGVIPGDVLHVPEMEYSADSPVVKAIVGAILANPQKAVALASVDQITLPFTTLGQLVLSIVRPIGYNIRGTNDLLARTGGQSPFGNVGVWYTRLGLIDPFLNVGVGRFAAQAGGIRFLSDYYQTRGTLAIPLLTLHTTLDPDVPFFHERAYAKIVAAARTAKWLTQQSVQRYGHCNVTPAEMTMPRP